MEDILFNGYDLTFNESVPILLQNQEIVRLDKKWLIEKSNFIEKLFTYHNYTLINLSTINRKILSHLIDVLNNEWEWLRLSDYDELPSVFQALWFTLDYLDIKTSSIFIFDLKELDNCKYLRVVLFLIPLLDSSQRPFLVKQSSLFENAYQKEEGEEDHESISYLPQSLPPLVTSIVYYLHFKIESYTGEFTSLFRILKDLPFFQNVNLIPIAQVLQRCKSFIRINPRKRFWNRLREFVNLSKDNPWPKDLTLSGESLATLFFDRELDPNENLRFQIRGTRQPQKALKDSLDFLTHGEDVKYVFEESRVIIYREGLPPIELIYMGYIYSEGYVLRQDASHLQMFFDGHYTYLSPEAYLSWKLRVTYLKKISIIGLHDTFRYGFDLINWEVILDECIYQMSLKDDFESMTKSEQIEIIKKYLKEDEYFKYQRSSYDNFVDLETVLTKFKYINYSSNDKYWRSLDESDNLEDFINPTLFESFQLNRNSTLKVPFRRAILLKVRDIQGLFHFSNNLLDPYCLIYSVDSAFLRQIEESLREILSETIQDRTIAFSPGLKNLYLFPGTRSIPENFKNSLSHKIPTETFNCLSSKRMKVNLDILLTGFICKEYFHVHLEKKVMFFEPLE